MDIYVNRHCPARTHNKHIHTHSHTHIHTYKHIQSYIVDTHTQIHIRVGSRHSRSVLIIRNTVVHVAIQTRLNLTLHSCNYYYTWITDHVQVWVIHVWCAAVQWGDVYNTWTRLRMMSTLLSVCTVMCICVWVTIWLNVLVCMYVCVWMCVDVFVVCACWAVSIHVDVHNCVQFIDKPIMMNAFFGLSNALLSLPMHR